MRFGLIDFNQAFDPESVITTKDSIVRDRQKRDSFAEGSIYCSKIFGKPFGETIAYECECGHTKGKFAEGIVCPQCKSKVERRESFLTKQGWIDFDGFRLINPLMYYLIEKIIPSVDLNGILANDRRLDVDGHIVESEKDEKSKKKLIDMGIYSIGVTAFLDNFFPILDEFVKPATQPIYDFLYANFSKVAIEHFPVISQRLRPAILMGEEFRFDKINNLYTRVVTSSESLKESVDSEKNPLVVEPILYAMQRFINQIYENIIDAISGKPGWLRNNLMANRTNFSSRCVITPNQIGNGLDYVELPYLAAVELLKFHIIRILLPLYGYNYGQAHAIWQRAKLGFDEEVYSIIELIMAKEEGGLQILINRNPTIAFGSILQMQVGRVKREFNDLTLGIPNNILSLISGDFDGDVLAIFLILDQKFKRHFSLFNPKNMMISNNDGKFNSALGLDKDYQLGLHSLLKAR